MYRISRNHITAKNCKTGSACGNSLSLLLSASPSFPSPFRKIPGNRFSMPLPANELQRLSSRSRHPYRSEPLLTRRFSAGNRRGCDQTQFVERFNCGIFRTKDRKALNASQEERAAARWATHSSASSFRHTPTVHLPPGHEPCQIKQPH